MNCMAPPISMAETLLADLLVGILVYEGDSGKCVLANPSVADRLGGSVGALCLKNFRDLDSWRNVLLRDRGGNMKGTLSSGEDITERKHAEEQIVSLDQDLQTEGISRGATFYFFTPLVRQWREMMGFCSLWGTQTYAEGCGKRWIKLLPKRSHYEKDSRYSASRG
jgi:hypothetical protein